MQARCMELTLELSQNKWPPPDTLGALFDANLPALLALPAAALFGGVRWATGRVRDSAHCLLVGGSP